MHDFLYIYLVVAIVIAGISGDMNKSPKEPVWVQLLFYLFWLPILLFFVFFFAKEKIDDAIEARRTKQLMKRAKWEKEN